MLAIMAIRFEQTEDRWFGHGSKYEMRREGLRVGQRFVLLANGEREVAFFAWQAQKSGPTGPEYTWILGASPRIGETGLGLETYASVFGAFFEAYQKSMGLPPGSLGVAFDPDIEGKAWDRWGP